MTSRLFTHIRLSVAAAAIVFTSAGALASGSEAGAMAETGDTAAYNMGKSLVATKLACSTCPMAGRALDAAAARELLTNKRGVALSAKEAAAVDTYLKRRFKL